MEIFNATNLLYIWGGFVKTIEISALSIFFFGNGWRRQSDGLFLILRQRINR